MKALLDTHVFLWWTSDDSRLSTASRKFISDGNNEVFFSVASAWEIAIKYGNGRLTLPEPPDTFVPSRIARESFSILPVELDHALAVHALPAVHLDPFDRLLVAQAISLNLPIISGDHHVAQYEVDTIW